MVDLCTPGPHCLSRTSPPTILAPQISTQRKVNIYNVLQEVIQQEGELEERCVQRLVAIASKEMRGMLEVAGVLPYSPVPPQGLGSGGPMGCPRPLCRALTGTTAGWGRPGEPSGAGAGEEQELLGRPRVLLPCPADGGLREGRGGQRHPGGLVPKPLQLGHV